MKMRQDNECILRHVRGEGSSNTQSNFTERIAEEWDESMSVDFVLVYDNSDSNPSYIEKRKVFEKNLIEEGLILNTVRNPRDHLSFVKIHATKEVLARYSEILKIRLPMQPIPGQEEMIEKHVLTEVFKENINRFIRFVNLDPEYFTKNKYEMTAEFSRSKKYLFDLDNPKFFPQAVRISVVDFILERNLYNTNPKAVFDFGINRLISKQVYKTAYPLHDGGHKENGTVRFLLVNKWAELKNWIYFQPIEVVKDYFGIKFALYFAWLGFYTYMLIPASFVGIICFIFGVASLPTDTYSNDICDSSLNITMCPLCTSGCDYWKLDESCVQAKITYLFDNDFTVAFAMFMAFWGSVYLELWKRYSAEMTHRWGLMGFDLETEQPRPQYLAKLRKSKKQKRNAITGKLEPIPAFWTEKIPAIILSYSVVLFMVLIAVGIILSVISYKISWNNVQSFFGEKDNLFYRDIIIPCWTAVINLILITILNLLYKKIALCLTNNELLRTQTEFDDSVTLKMYMLQFVNYYSSIFYIAFFKGKFIGHPKKYNKIFGLKQEECSPGGCFHEIFLHLVIIMIGRKVLMYAIEFIIQIYKKLRDLFKSTMMKNNSKSRDDCPLTKTRWTEDYKLAEWPERGLFNEYLEMVLQFGFVTIFVAAFPLAPLCALILNILELRRDAKKFLKNYRRPVPCRARDIGIWYKILKILGRISVFSNAFIIGFTSNFIPRLVYKTVVSGDHTEEGFLNHSLSYFDTKDLEFGAPTNSKFGNVEVCRYRNYRSSPWELNDPKYELSEIYWHILVARLAFVVIFQNVVAFVRMLLESAIPDISRKLNDQIKREVYLTSEIILRHEEKLANEQSSHN